MFDNGFDFEALGNDDGVVTAFTKGYGRRAKKMRENDTREKESSLDSFINGYKAMNEDFKKAGMGNVLTGMIAASAAIATVAVIGGIILDAE